MASANDSEAAKLLNGLTEAEARAVLYDWRLNARPKQLLPGTDGAEHARRDWLYWLVLAGRGFGKTRVGAEAVKHWARNPKERILLVGPTASDVNEVMIHGPSGLMSVYAPWEPKPRYIEQKHTIQFPGGAIGITRSAEEPERLRGPQFGKFWFDELCAAQYAKQAWEQIEFGFRLPSPNLQGLITTTPKPIPTLKRILAHARTVVTRGSSDENRSNLSPDYVSTVIEPYRGTRLGRQEIDAEILEDIEGALWARGAIDATRITFSSVRWENLIRIVVAVDPAVTSNPDSDETGIIVAGLTRSHHVVILEDASGRYSAPDWARRVANLYAQYRADVVVGEVNNGGDLVERNVRVESPHIAFRAVRATRGKYLRAEPVSTLYERGLVHHAGAFRELEDQMVNWTPLSGQKSPDRLDALVWAVTDLLIDQQVVSGAVQFAQPEDISLV